MAGAVLPLLLWEPEVGRALERNAGGNVARIAESRLASDLAAFERLIARRPKTAPRAIREGLARGEAQDVVVLFFAADVEFLIGRLGVGRAQARRLRAERYATRKQAAVSPLDPDYAVLREYRQLPMTHMWIRTIEALERLLSRPEVAAVYENTRYTLQLDQSLPLIGQPAAAAAGHRGAGTTVVVLDTGVEYTRAAFGSCTAPGVPAGCRVVVSEDFAPQDNLLDDPENHGTLVSAIVLGVAPDTRLAVLDVFEGESGLFSAILAGLDWAIVNRDLYNIAAVNMSLGGGDGEISPCVEGGYHPVVLLLRSEGIIPVAASGNNGFTDRLGTPACTPGLVSVGAVYDANVGPVNTTTCSDATSQADQVMCFSDSATFLTLLAPGGPITAAGESGFGTSLSSPHVAGAVAVLKSTYPNEAPDQIIARMTSTGTPITDLRNNITKPRLALDRAVAAPSPPAPPAPALCPAQGVICPANITANLSTSSCGTGRLSSGHFTNAYEFAGVAGQTVTIRMTATLTVQQLDTYLVLISPSGAIAAQNDDINLGVDTNSRITLTLNETGTWRVEASSFGPGMTGDYALTISGCSPPQPSVCTPGANTLCLSGGRFRVQANWTTADGRSGAANAVNLTPDTGYFWFFDPANVEMITKVLNACGINQRIWVFAGGLTNVDVTLTVEDTANGTVQIYRNPQGTAFLPIQDTQAFPTCPQAVAASSTASVSARSRRAKPGWKDARGWSQTGAFQNAVPTRPKWRDAGPSSQSVAAPCAPDANTLCLSSGRFRVRTEWRTADGRSGIGEGVKLTPDTGYFWFFDSGNVEMVVKVLNACGINQRIWAFAGGLTNVEVTMTVEDTDNGTIQTYENPQSTPFAPIQDTAAFSTCP